MIKRWKIFLTSSLVLLFLFLFPQMGKAASPLDLVTSEGEVIPYDGYDTAFSSPSQIGYQNTSSQERVPLFEDVTPADGLAIQARTILGTDDRQPVMNTTVFPYSAVVFIVATYANGSSYVGSGTMISPDAVLTAGHVIFDPHLKQWPQTVTVYPAINGTIAPFGHTTASKLLALAGWTENLSSKHDLGIIRLTEPLGVKTGWFGLTSEIDPTQKLYTAGYPTDKPRQTMWQTTGTIKSMTEANIYYDLDTYPGQSGSGVYNVNNQIMTVHAYSQAKQNFGTRLAPSVLNWIQADLANVNSVYRLYDPNDGEHFYTKDPNEVNVLQRLGWSYEGLAWFAPAQGQAVYRLYNPNSGDHHYTTSSGERAALVQAGWRAEGVSWEASPTNGTATYRLYNPNAKTGTHHYTVNLAERDHLLKLGWRDEGIAWYNL